MLFARGPCPPDAISRAGTPRRMFPQPRRKRRCAASQRRAAELLSLRTRRKPAGALRVPARRQFTLPATPAAPGQTRLEYRRITCHDAIAQVCTESGASLDCTKFAQPVFLHTDRKSVV